jgi:SsrA-binding protein
MIVKNRKASYDYNIKERLVAGLVLTGPEVKAFKKEGCDLSGAYCEIRNNELYLVNCHIDCEKDKRRPRKLLLNRKEINRINVARNVERCALPILEVAVNDVGLIKATIAVAKGKKQYDKRRSIRERDEKRMDGRTG